MKFSNLEFDIDIFPEVKDMKSLLDSIAINFDESILIYESYASESALKFENWLLFTILKSVYISLIKYGDQMSI